MKGDYCIYLRKSRADHEAEARGEGETLARHRRILLSLAKQMEITITEIYEEVESGENISDRPEVQRLLKDVEDGLWDGVLVMEVERLARGDTVDQGIVARAFKESNTKIITPQKTFDPSNEFDEEYFEFSLFMSRREYKVINRRQQAGRLASAKEGRWPGNQAPYGYKRVPLPDKGYTLEIVPEEAEIVRMVFDWYVNGIDTSSGKEQLGTSKIARRLNEMNIPTRKNKRWITATIRDMIRNETYIGMVPWGKRAAVKKRVNGDVTVSRPRSEGKNVFKGLHKPIIDRQTFEKAQEIMDRNAHAPLSRGRLSNPLAGIIRCGKCGEAMVRRPYPKNKIAPHIICVNQTCDNKSSRQEYIEKAVIQALKHWVAEYSANLNIKDKKIDLSYYEKKVERAEENLNRLHKQNSNLHDLLEQGVYTVDNFLKRSNELSERIKEAKDKLNRAKEELLQQKQIEEAKTNIIPAVKNVISGYEQTDDIQIKNKLLKTVLEKAEYRKEKWQQDDDFEIIIYPKIGKI